MQIAAGFISTPNQPSTINETLNIMKITIEIEEHPHMNPPSMQGISLNLCHSPSIQELAEAFRSILFAYGHSLESINEYVKTDDLLDSEDA